MSERKIVRVRAEKSGITVTSSDTYQCIISLAFETETKAQADCIIKKLSSMTFRDTDGISDDAIAVLQNDLSELEKAKEILIRQHRSEISQLLQNAASNIGEINRLKTLEGELAQLAVLPVPKVVR